MNQVEKIVMTNLVEALEHVVRVYTSMADRGAYPDELVPFQIRPPFGETNPRFLGRQGFQDITVAIKAAKELLGPPADIVERSA